MDLVLIEVELDRLQPLDAIRQGGDGVGGEVKQVKLGQGGQGEGEAGQLVVAEVNLPGMA